MLDPGAVPAAGALENGTAPDFDLAGFDLAGIKFWLDCFEAEVEKGFIRCLRGSRLGGVPTSVAIPPMDAE